MFIICSPKSFAVISGGKKQLFTGKGNDKQFQHPSLENHMNSMKRQKVMPLKDKPQVSRCTTCYW